MARRQQSSPLEDLITVASKLPWWVSILLAFISYAILHALANRPLVAASGQLGDAFSRSLITYLAMFGQYLLPFAFGVGALISGISSVKRRKLYEGVQSRSDVATLNEMSWGEFESLVGEYFRRSGFQVSHEGGNGPDGGVDLVLRKGREKHLVQCKQWKAYKVGVQPVREFYGVMAASGAAGGYFVTSGIFTDDAQGFAQGLNLELIDGRKLKAMIGPPGKIESRGKIEPVPCVQERPQAATASPSSLPLAAPACPKCGAEMKRRVVRKGGNAGKEFWGCSAYPKCSGTRLSDGGPDSGPAPTVPAAVVKAAPPEKRTCPHCGQDLVFRQFQSGPRAGQEFYGCVPCKKGWPVSAGGPS